VASPQYTESVEVHRSTINNNTCTFLKRINGHIPQNLDQKELIPQLQLPEFKGLAYGDFFFPVSAKAIPFKNVHFMVQPLAALKILETITQPNKGAPSIDIGSAVSAFSHPPNLNALILFVEDDRSYGPGLVRFSFPLLTLLRKYCAEVGNGAMFEFLALGTDISDGKFTHQILVSHMGAPKFPNITKNARGTKQAPTLWMPDNRYAESVWFPSTAKERLEFCFHMLDGKSGLPVPIDDVKVDAMYGPLNQSETIMELLAFFIMKRVVSFGKITANKENEGKDALLQKMIGPAQWSAGLNGLQNMASKILLDEKANSFLLSEKVSIMANGKVAFGQIHTTHLEMNTKVVAATFAKLLCMFT